MTGPLDLLGLTAAKRSSIGRTGHAGIDTSDGIFLKVPQPGGKA
jgi:hypothetical protein